MPGRPDQLKKYIGQKFSRLTILSIERVQYSYYKVPYANCICECGKEKRCSLSSIRRGTTKSCGCYNIEAIQSRGKYSRLNPGFSRHPLYRVWMAMRRRCHDFQHVHYDKYGGRGVVVCEEWNNDFKKFFDWAHTNGWAVGLQLDKDIKGDGKIYSPSTCCFVTPTVNYRAKANCRRVTYNGETKPLSEWCELLNMKYTTIRNRLVNMGMSPVEAFKKVA